MCQEHLDANPLNLRMLNDFCKKWVIHLRDPRSVVLSWTHHINKYNAMGGHNRDAARYFWNSPQEEDYFSWELEKQLDRNIDCFLPEVTHWMEGWLEVYDSGKYNIMLTKYEDLIVDEKAFFQKILDFYQITETHQGSQPLDVHGHFRSGKKDEWRQVFTPQQINRSNRQIGETLLSRFGWEK